MKRRLFIYGVLICIFSVFLLASCSQNGDIDISDVSSETIQNVFRGIDFEVIQDLKIEKDMLPYYDTTSETVTFFSFYSECSEDTQTVTELYGELLTFSTDGTLLETSKFQIDDNIGKAVVTEDAVIYTHLSKTNRAVYRFDRKTGETTSVIPEELFGITVEYNINTFFITIDSAGNIYCTDQNTLFVLTPDLSPAYTFKFPSKVYTMARGADGNVWVTFSAGMESCVAYIDSETKALGEYHTFVRGANQLESIQHWLINAYTASDTHSFYYYDSDALYGVGINENGSLTEDVIVDFYNSGINTGTIGNYRYVGYETGIVYPMVLLAEDFLLTVSYNNNETVPTIYYKEEDLNLSSIHTITIASAYALDPTVISRITKFNKENTDSRIIVKDYSEYSTDENRAGGEEKLCFDITNGYIKPDIVITQFLLNMHSENSVVSQLIDKNLYVDLTPYLETDENVNFNTLFGCIPRIFDDGQGGIWGLCTEFTISTLLGSRERLGEYAAKGYWTMGEMLDFFDSLPEGAEEYYSSTRDIPIKQTTAQGSNIFIDGNVCNFTSEDFIRYLEYVKSLPEDFTDWKRLGNTVLNTDEQKSALISGDLGVIFYHISSPVSFDGWRCLISEDFCPIGFPTKTDSGIRINTEYAYAITTFASEPDLCFDLLTTFFDLDSSDYSFEYEYPIFALKPNFEKLIDNYNPVFATAEKLTPDELSAIYEVIDNAGSPIIYETTESINAIVTEEISAYLADVGTAQSCAEKIESRINIWLSEHEG